MVVALAGIVFLGVRFDFSKASTTSAMILGALFLVGSAAALALDQDQN